MSLDLWEVASPMCAFYFPSQTVGLQCFFNSEMLIKLQIK
jgi:hypothetical protein